MMQRFSLNPVQKEALDELIQQTLQELVEIDFESPEMDAKTIRRHAYLKGKLEAYSIIHRDEFEQPEPVNASQNPEGM